MNKSGSNYRFSCEKCKFFTNSKTAFNNHCITGKHLTGERKVRCDKQSIDQCPQCDFKSKNITNMKSHILNNHKTKEDRKKEFKYYCEMCDFGSFIETSFDIHKKSKKHIQIEKYAENIKKIV
jgi:hypothetical protein